MMCVTQPLATKECIGYRWLILILDPEDKDPQRVSLDPLHAGIHIHSGGSQGAVQHNSIVTNSVIALEPDCTAEGHQELACCK